MTEPSQILRVGERIPRVHDEAFVAPGAVVVGDVTLGARSSVWYASVVRGDTSAVTIGEETNIQDGSVLHADPDSPLTVGSRVTVGHRVVLHGATVEDDVLIGMGSVVMNDARIGAGSVIGAGAVVTQGTEIPPQSLVLGSPAKVVREARDPEREMIRHGARNYVQRASEHRDARPA